MAITLAEHCVYTIVQGDKLETKTPQGGKVTFIESKKWVTGFRLWQQAMAADACFPLLLGNATDCSRLEYWGLLTKIVLTDAGTSYTVDDVREFTVSHKPQELTLRSSGKCIAPGFIKPYAICLTPDFLVDEFTKSLQPKRRK